MKMKTPAFPEYPAWYWVFGLHDAEILSFSEMELPTDWKSKAPRYNCLEIRLNPAGAREKIKRIVFYNYSLKSEIDMSTVKKSWWMGDTLTRLPDGRFSLEAEIVDTKGDRYSFSVTFEETLVETVVCLSRQ